MAETAAWRLKALGITLPTPTAPQANYIPTVTVGRLIFVSGQISSSAEGRFIGKVGHDYTVEQGAEAARMCAINILAQLNAALGDIEKVARLVKLTGFVNCTPDFDEPQNVVNGASDFLVEVLGERGRHARSAIGVATLPLGAAVEVEAIAEIA
jgi:enamine deaminase RidA (YjgF/YER057c/UK114 family)